MSKPIQIAVGYARGPHEQYGSRAIYVLCDDGAIYVMDTSCYPVAFVKIGGPWDE